MANNNRWLFTVLFRIAAVFAILGIVCLFICEPRTAEFSVSIAVVVLNVAIVAVSAIIIRKNKSE